MLYIPFVENAFKHCNRKNVPGAIRISFSIENNLVNFECMNAFDITQKITTDKASGIGLSIIKRRLELIYPDTHALHIEEQEDTYKVTLLVNTYEHSLHRS
jgi:sensor histidine kinase YesM